MQSVKYADLIYGDKVTIDACNPFIYNMESGKATFICAYKPDGRSKRIVVSVRPYNCSNLVSIEEQDIISVKKGWA